MKDENGELNQQLIVCREENQLLKYKIMSVEVEADCAKKIGMHQNDYELMKEALEMCTDSNPVTQKRPSDERSESHVKKPRIDDSNIPEPDLGDDRQSRKDSCRPVHATSYSDRTPDTMAKSPYRTASSPENTSQSGSPVCRTITTVAQIHAEPGKSDNSHKEKPRKKKAKQNVTRKSARNKGKRASQSRDRIPDPADRLPSGKVSTPFVSSNRGKANTDTDKENEDGRSKNCDNGLSGDESTSDD
ncbi:hypothetical protein HA402_013670 [Bradysia odoriphaga]|nr:hypothetical protein HA402_013670 [Bradysia odoriphaga]